MANVGYQARDYSDEEEFHSAGNSPVHSRVQEMWTFERDIGQGGFGVVKLFAHKLTGSKLVLKECRQLNISRDSFNRWMQEMEIIKRLDHKNIVKAQNPPEDLYYRPHGDVPCIYMEFCEGGDLRQVLRDPDNCCGLPEEDIRQLCSDVNAGIQFLHQAKVVHRDLKPENILRKIVNKNKVLYKLTDFGYAKSYDQSSVCTSLVGTMQYVNEVLPPHNRTNKCPKLAPEVLKGQKYNSSVDVWSFGVVVFECITGIRPFLHGEPNMTIFWVDCVAKKAPNVIHIHYDGSDKPVYSEQLPKPHRLSRPLEVEMTRWLQTALQFVPEQRGAKRVNHQDAPCIVHMERILETKVINVVCTTVGDVFSYSIDNSTTVGSLKQLFQCDSEVGPEDQYILRPDGTIPLDSDLASSCLQHENLGTLFVFTVAQMPSFRVMHDSNAGVTKLTSFGDENIPTDDRRVVFSQVFHHIRAHHSFFERLHQAHQSILHQIRIQVTVVREGEQNLLRCFDVVSALLKILGDELSSDQSHFSQLPINVSNKLRPIWDTMAVQLDDYNTQLSQLTNQIADMRKEAETYLRLAEEMIETDADNGRQFEHYYQTYVARAKDILSDVKASKGRQLSSRGRMQDVLLQAIQRAQFIIETRLNGLSFCQEYVALGHLIQRVESNREQVEQLRGEVAELSASRCEVLWRVVRQQTELQHKTAGLTATNSTDSNDGEVLSQQISSQSEEEGVVSLVGSVSDPVLVRRFSVSKEQRNVSQDQTKDLLDRNRQLLKRLASLPGPTPPILPTRDSHASLPSIPSGSYYDPTV